MSTERRFSRPRAYCIFVVMVVTALLLPGCILPISTSSTPIPTSVSVPATQPSIPAGPATPVTLATPTSNPISSPSGDFPATLVSTPVVPTAVIVPATPTTSIPTAIPQPTAAIVPVGTIAFTPGTTATVVQGTLTPGQVVTYTLGAAQGQPLVLLLDPPQNDVTFGVFNPDGSILLSPASQFKNWQTVLPQTGLYKIQLIGGVKTESFILTVKIAQVVNFALGASSVTLPGTTLKGYLFDYALNCSAGQTMSVSLNVPASTAYLDIFGITTGTILSDTARTNSWTGVLMQTQQYVVEVVPANGQVVNYTLTVSVGATTIVAVTPGAPLGDIVIAPGSTAAVKGGTINPGQVITYTIQANQYQPMVLVLNSDRGDVYLGVVAPDGMVMLTQSKKWTYWQWRLPQTGLYKIQVVGGAIAEKFDLTTKLPRMVSFAPGTSSITLKGATEQGFVVSYSFRLSFGQTMTASLDVPSSTAYLAIYGLTTGSLLSYTDKSNYWKGVLPESQEYIIDVIPRGGGIEQFRLTVSVE